MNGSRRIVRRSMAASALALLLWAALTALLASPASADDCSSPEDCEQTGGYNGAIAVVGGIAAVTAAALAARDATPEGEETDLAIVQVSNDMLFVSPDSPDQVTLTGWHAGDGGKLTRVPMTLWIEVPPAEGVKVTPTQGTGEMLAMVEFDEATFDDTIFEVELVAHGSWDGKEATATITVMLDGDYNLEWFS